MNPNFKLLRYGQSQRVGMHITPDRQRGVSFIEVIVAMFILTFGALAIVKLQTASAIGISKSGDHLHINALNHVIAEQLKADSVRAASGQYNTSFSDVMAPVTAPADIAKNINVWKVSFTRSILYGETQIDCNRTECTIELKWYEPLNNGNTDQVMKTKIPI